MGGQVIAYMCYSKYAVARRNLKNGMSGSNAAISYITKQQIPMQELHSECYGDKSIPQRLLKYSMIRYH